MDDETQDERKCPICGNDKSEPGTVGGHYPFKYKSDMEKSIWFGGQDTRAQRCTKCGFVAIFAD